ERVLGPDVDLALGDLQRLREAARYIRTGREAVKALLDDVARLPDPLGQDPQTVVAVAAGPEGHLELDLAVLLVRLVLAGVHRHAGGMKHRARAAVHLRDRARDRADVAAALEDDLVAH